MVTVSPHEILETYSVPVVRSVWASYGFYQSLHVNKRKKMLLLTLTPDRLFFFFFLDKLFKSAILLAEPRNPTDS